MTIPKDQLSYVLLRDGEKGKLVQVVTKTGLPCCIECGRPIPVIAGRRDEWFCRQGCAVQWAYAMVDHFWTKEQDQVKGGS